MMYILDKNGKPKIEKDVIKWCKWNSLKGNRIVKHEKVGRVLISTVFLALDHSFVLKKHKPILWETMIFDSKKFKDYQVRYSSLEEAKKGHRKAVLLVKKSQKK